jgi:hypothetical protein
VRGALVWLARLAALAGVLAWIRASVAGPAPVPSIPIAVGPKHRASGVVHIHTSLSDGRGTPADVVAAARSAGADFVVVTDHNRVEPATFADIAQPGAPLLISGSEISTEGGHILAVGLRAPAFRFSGTLREVLDDVRHLGGCAFAAHPTSPRGETRFTREEEPGGFGIEVVNGDTAWREASPPAIALAAWTYPVNPAFALARTLGTFEAERRLWDSVLARRFAPAVGSVDAHGRIPISAAVSLPVPSYSAQFGLARTVVHLDQPLPSHPAAARAAVAKALCSGSSVVAIPSLADPKGFFFVARTIGDEVAGPGSTVRFAPGLRLQAGGAAPVSVIHRLVESGKVVATASGFLDHAVSSPGVYRVEAYVNGKATPWILSNPISILTAESERARLEAARPSYETQVEGTVVIDSFDGATGFAAEHDPWSAVAAPIIVQGGGRGRGGAALLSFRLNSASKPPAWCALVDRTARDLSANRGVSFWLRADGEYRVWFQIRDLNPDSKDEGTEAWFASVRTSAAWTLHNIPFASLRSINKASDGSFDARKVAHIVFVIDHGAMPYGASGRVWIDDLKAY